MYNAVIIGAGSIGALKPDKYDSPDTENILTIAHAFYNHPDINLIGIVDNDIEKAILASKKWNTKAYTDINYIKENIDIAAICVPTDWHKSVIEEVLKYNPKIIMAEKPFCTHLITAKHINNLTNIPILIDYIRRYTPQIQALRNALVSNIYGKIYHAKLTYTRGLKREACHAIDLFNWIFGEFRTGRVLGYRDEALVDFDFNDKTYAVHLIYENCPHVFLCPVDGRDYAVFDIEIFTEKGKILIKEHSLKIEHFNVIPEKTYGNYMMLGDKFWEVKTDLKTALMNYVQNAIDVIEGKKKPICDINDAIKVHEVYEKLGV